MLDDLDEGPDERHHASLLLRALPVLTTNTEVAR
jgi:hypothetical protein